MGLEIIENQSRVHCRTGSSENGPGRRNAVHGVHCRTGSSEMFELFEIKAAGLAAPL